MTRARATALALVNWKGVFYERYLLDPNVTALEGANGAGKTTVMIAAYVVLMPDMSRLRFTNLGESGATGGDKGIWGRLGEPGSASYAAIEVLLHGGARLIAGVELTRKAEPSVELTPFLITGLNPEARLQDLLLQRRGGADEVPTRAELIENAKTLGGELQAFQTAKDYFAALFEHGVSPLRLSTDEDRNKFNEMLRTSMTGGISRALTSELRSFLLREESGLGDTLSRMRANLDACRRTRVEVSEAQRLEHEIAGVFEAGQSMFGAALLATREEANELSLSVVSARAAEQKAARELSELDRIALETKTKHAIFVTQLHGKRAELKRALEGQAQLAHAQSLAGERTALETERALCDANAAAALDLREHAAGERAGRLTARDRARAAYDRSAQGLADIQKGLDELHRNAHRERRAKSLLLELRERLHDPTLEGPSLSASLERVRRELGRVDEERLRSARDAQLIELRHTEYHAAVAAFAAIDPESAGMPSYERAHAELARLARLEEVALRAPALSSALRETEALAARQTSAGRRARELGFTDPSVLSPEFLTQTLTETEQALAAARDAERAAHALLERTSQELDACDAELRDLEERMQRRNAAYSLLSTIEPSAEPWTLERAQELSARLEDEYDTLRATASELTEQREALLHEANAFEVHGGAAQPELMRLRDELDAELLGQRFEDIEPEQAAALEARLGPLVNALLVPDPMAAAEALAGRPRELESIWLVASDTRIETTVTDPSLPDIVVMDGIGVRVTRVPAKPMLGRRARLERARVLRLEAEALATRLDGVERRCRRLETSLRDVRPITSDVSLIGGERLSPLREACQLRREELLDAQRNQAIEHGVSVALGSELAPRVAALRSLLVDAFLFDGRDHTEAYTAIATSMAEGEAAQRELNRVGSARQALELRLQALRFPPGKSDALDALREERSALDRERDRLFRAQEALVELTQLNDALGSRAEERAEQSVALVPALEDQHESARQVLELSERALEEAELARERATLAWQAVEGERAALTAQCVRLDGELSRLGVADFSTLDLRSQTQLISDLSLEAESCEREERELGMTVATLDERRRELSKSNDAAWRALAAAEKQAEPSANVWQSLRATVTRGGLASAPLLDAPAPRPSGELWADARSKYELLLDRLTTAHGGLELGPALKALFGADARNARGDTFLQAWLVVREWLGNRVPTQVADVSDPLEALERLRDHLFSLERRLARQEGDLRGATEDIARSIEVQLRRAGSQVRRLNQSLGPMRFGSIQGIRVRAERVERMAQVLCALREGDAQELLFQPTLPIEDALNEVFRRYAGGKSGGHRILDYREYVELSVEILRQSSDTWELANPTRLSTGEAIGVGAALMMVVLSEWERDANLLRGKRDHGSLRFLFLDEANRLSPDNLGVLFDLCQSLELQLLIAAPEVARADGNTTYRLIRTITDDGREEVIVSGRRAAMPAAPPAVARDAPQEAEQGAFRFE